MTEIVDGTLRFVGKDNKGKFVCNVDVTDMFKGLIEQKEAANEALLKQRLLDKQLFYQLLQNIQYQFERIEYGHIVGNIRALEFWRMSLDEKLSPEIITALLRCMNDILHDLQYKSINSEADVLSLRQRITMVIMTYYALKEKDIQSIITESQYEHLESLVYEILWRYNRRIKEIIDYISAQRFSIWLRYFFQTNSWNWGNTAMNIAHTFEISDDISSLENFCFKFDTKRLENK